MTKITWKFSIVYDGFNGLTPRSNGFFASSAQDVERLGRVAKLHVVAGIRRGREYRKIAVDCEEGDPSLQVLLDAAFRMYSFSPSQYNIIPESQRGTTFGVRRERKYSPSALAECPLLMLHSDRVIADDGGRSNEEIVTDQYVVKSYRPKKTVPLGVLAPFSAIAVGDKLKKQLEKSKLLALYFENVSGSSQLWKLGSSVRMPETSVPLVDGTGRQVSSENDWSKFEERWFDDGFIEAELVYSKNSLTPFDIGVTAERVGQHNAGAYRRCIVTQKFRNFLHELGVSGIRYTPVWIED